MLRLILLRLLESYFRHRWLYLAPAALMLAAGIAFAFLAPTRHTATGTLLIEKQSLLATLTSNGQGASYWRTPAEITAGELRELLATDAFVRSAIQKTSWEPLMHGSPREVRDALTAFRRSITVTALGEKLVAISARDGNAQVAQQMAASVMDSYIQWQINKEFQESVVAQNFFANLIGPYQEDLQRARDNLRTYLETYPEPLRGSRPPEERMEIARLESEIRRAEERVSETLKNEESARLALAKAESITRQTYMVIDAPTPPIETFSLRRTALLIGIFAGVGVGLSLAGVVTGALLDRTLRFPVDVRHALHLPLLATVAAETVTNPGRPQRLPGDARHPQRADAGAGQPGTVKPRA